MLYIGNPPCCLLSILPCLTPPLAHSIIYRRSPHVALVVCAPRHSAGTVDETVRAARDTQQCHLSHAATH